MKLNQSHFCSPPIILFSLCISLSFNPTSLRFSAVDTPDPIPVLARGVSPLEGLDTAGLGSGTVIFWGLSFVRLVEFAVVRRTTVTVGYNPLLNGS